MKQRKNSSEIERELSKEILKNERFRLLVLVAVISAIIPISLFGLFFYESNFELVFNDPNYFVGAVGLFLFIILRSILIRKKIEKWEKNKVNIPEIFRYINSFIEVTIPTIALVIMHLGIQSVEVLVSPMVFLYFLFIILSTLELDLKLSIFAGSVAAIEYLILALYYLNTSETKLDSALLNFFMPFAAKSLILLISGIVAGIVAVRIKKYIINSYERLIERNHIEKIFGQQVSPKIVEELINAKQEIESRRRFVAIMFLDIRGFTPFSENKTPEEIVAYQNDVFSFMIDRVNENNGIINQFMGDGFMATFGAPIAHGNDCQNAVNTAISILKDIESKNENKEIPFTKIGIGIHAGEVVTGNVGTSVRKQYSITGNVVILASRIEQLNKKYESQLLISKEVLNKIELNNASLIERGFTDIKGRSEPMEIFEIKI